MNTPKHNGFARTKTTNGAGAFTSTNNKLVDLFFNIGAARNNLEGIRRNFADAVKQDELKATAILLWARDIRHNGAGARIVFRTLLKDLISMNKPGYTKKVVELIPEIGRFDDLKATYGTRLEKVATTLWADAILANNVLAAKWAKRDDKILQKAMNMNEAQLRRLLSSVRKKFIPEAKMCANEWEAIEYDKIPSVCGMRHANAFKRHDGERYEAFINSKETKVNASAAFPHDVYRMYKCGENAESVTKYWENLPQLELMGNVLPIVDVSGSMCYPASGKISCMDVSISLGTYLSQQVKGIFQNTMLTFSENPTLVSIPKTRDIGQIFDFVQRIQWGGSTNIEASYDLILTKAKQMNAAQKDMPTHLLILSDMQFNECARTYTYNRKTGKYEYGTKPETVLENMKKKFQAAGYKMPNLVFWNLSASYGNYPCTSSENGVALVSGFSPNVLKAILKGEEITPVTIMNEAIKPFIAMLQ